MTPKEAFKIGFLEKCAEDGLSNEEIVKRIRNSKMLVKLAYGGPGAVDDAAQGLFDLSSNIFNKVWPLILAGPPLLGAAGGYTLAQARGDTYDKDEAKTREVIGTYQQAISRLRALKKKQQEQQTRRSGR